MSSLPLVDSIKHHGELLVVSCDIVFDWTNQYRCRLILASTIDDVTKSDLINNFLCLFI